MRKVDGWSLPHGDVDERKYAVMAWALARAREGLNQAVSGDLEGIEPAYAATHLRNLAISFGFSEEELAVDWSEHLSADEIYRARWAPDSPASSKRPT